MGPWDDSSGWWGRRDPPGRGAAGSSLGLHRRLDVTHSVHPRFDSPEFRDLDLHLLLPRCFRSSLGGRRSRRGLLVTSSPLLDFHADGEDGEHTGDGPRTGLGLGTRGVSSYQDRVVMDRVRSLHDDVTDVHREPSPEDLQRRRRSDLYHLTQPWDLGR